MIELGVDYKDDPVRELEGRRLDLAVATGIMGWGMPEVCESSGESHITLQSNRVERDCLRTNPLTGAWQSVPYYSRKNSGRVWRVMDTTGLVFNVKNVPFKGHPGWRVKCGLHGFGPFMATGTNGPQAICRAALLASQHEDYAN